MKTRFFKMMLCCLPFFFVGANSVTKVKDQRQVNAVFEQHDIDELDEQLMLYQSAIEMNLSEIKLSLFFQD